MKKRIAVIDTETTYYDDVMSIGIVIADSTDLKADMSLYYVFPEECWKLAAYRQYNPCIPEDAPCYKTGRLKSGYGVESIMRMLSGARNYSEVHNALCDAEDELKIMQLLKLDIDRYPEI